MGLFNRRKKPSPVRERLLSYQVANLQGRGTRERQEDSFAFANALDVTEILRRGLLAVVADGMGGLKDGREVSQACVAQVLSAFSDLDPEGDLAEQLRTWVDRANDALYGRFQGEGGTTLVACLFLREQLCLRFFPQTPHAPAHPRSAACPSTPGSVSPPSSSQSREPQR